jgi:hypothetical protein
MILPLMPRFRNMARHSVEIDMSSVQRIDEYIGSRNYLGVSGTPHSALFTDSRTIDVIATPGRGRFLSFGLPLSEGASATSAFSLPTILRAQRDLGRTFGASWPSCKQ